MKKTERKKRKIEIEKTREREKRERENDVKEGECDQSFSDVFQMTT